MKKMAKQLVGVTMILAAAAACEASPTGPHDGQDAPLPGEWEPVGGGSSPDTILLDVGRGRDAVVRVEIVTPATSGTEPGSPNTFLAR